MLWDRVEQRRELAARYRGSMLGVVWALVTPLVMIAIYTFIFAGIFGARFGAGGSAWDYALYIFCGMLPWTAFQEALQLSANVVVANANLVKRVVFPLETLPASGARSLAGQAFGSVAISPQFSQSGRDSSDVAVVPVVLVPQIPPHSARRGRRFAGVFLRDTAQGCRSAAEWMFLTPILYLKRSNGGVSISSMPPVHRAHQVHGASRSKSPARLAGLLLLSAFAVVVSPR